MRHKKPKKPKKPASISETCTIEQHWHHLVWILFIKVLAYIYRTNPRLFTELIVSLYMCSRFKKPKKPASVSLTCTI